jgi:cation diffusion facilitator family transporter
MNPLIARLFIPFAIVANGLMAVTKFAVAGWTGSSAMLSAAVHSAVDAGEGLLLVLGVRLGRRPRDASHPFGYRKVLYHWSLIVGVAIFLAGAALSIYQGVHRLRSPGVPFGWQLNLVVIAVAAVFEAFSFFVSLSRLRRSREVSDDEPRPPEIGDNGGVRAASVALIEDGAALVGLGLAAAGIVLSRVTGSSFYDGCASVAIGGVLLVVALVLARERRELTAGRTTREDVVQAIRASAEGTPGLTAVNRVLTMQLGPRRILVALDVALEQGITGPDLGRTLRRLEETIRRAHPVVRHIYVDVHKASGTVH